MSNNLVTLYRCDICQMASFPTMEEAIAHENECAKTQAAINAHPPPPQPQAQPQAPAAQPPPVNNNPPAAAENLLRVKYFKCSNCKILFTDREKARTHEATCNEPVWFSCRVCKIMRFSKAATLIEHERSCRGPVPLTRKDLPLAEETLKENGNRAKSDDDSSVEIIDPPVKSTTSAVPKPLAIPAPAPKSMEVANEDDSSVEIIDSADKIAAPLPPSAPASERTQKDPNYTTCWTCDVCKIANFKTYEEAEEHEVQCKIDMETKKKCWACDVCKIANFKTYKEAEEHEVQCKIDMETKKKSWTCDVCKIANFKTYKEAEEHEVQCKIDMETKKKEKETLPKKQANKGVEQHLGDSSQLAKNVELFSPFVQSVSDSADFEKISNCHAAILQSVRLLHHPFNGSVALQCQYCNQEMSTTWTFKKMTEMLPVLVCNHILECQNAPPEVVESMEEHITNILDKSSEIVGELSFGKFLESFLLANGIVEGAIKGDKQLVVIPDDKFRKINGSEMSKRGRQASSSTALIGTKKGKRQDGSSAESSPSSKRTKIQSVHEEMKIGDMDCQLHYEEGRSMYVGPLDGLPFLTSLLQKEAKYLHPSQKILLAQLEIFELTPKIMKGANDGSLGLRCQNCITEKNGCCFMKLTSVDNLARDVLLFGKEHVVRCITKQKVTKQILEALAGGDSELSKYCKLLANLYCLEQRQIGGKIHVKFGECPTIPSGYSHTHDIDFRSFLRPAETNRMNTNNVGDTNNALSDDVKPLTQAPVVASVSHPVVSADAT